MRTCHRHYPGRIDGTASLVLFHRLRPSPINRRVGSCGIFFEACSAFTHVMACTLAESPCDPFHRELRRLRYLCRRLDCYRVERSSSRAGVAPAGVQRLFTAHDLSTIRTPCRVWFACHILRSMTMIFVRLVGLVAVGCALAATTFSSAQTPSNSPAVVGQSERDF